MSTQDKKLREKRVLTETEFAILVNHHPETIGKMRRKGEINHCKRGRKVWYLNPQHVDAFNQKFEVRAA
jgi:hypothetical protein